MPTYENFKITFKNKHLIMENVIKCSVSEHEMNCSYNPSLLVSGSAWELKGFATGSAFVPYVTTVGLYNDQNDLLAIAKFSQPIPLSQDTDTNFLIRIDV